MKETEQTDQQKIRQLHECNSEIYSLIDKLNNIGVESMGLVFQNLRNASKEVHNKIGSLIDKTTNAQPDEPK